jgi:serine/threonine-protein kinase HipA
LVPTLQNLGYQAMPVGVRGAQSTLENALTELSEFGIKKPRAQALIAEVARVVDQWPQHFAQHSTAQHSTAQHDTARHGTARHGVCAADMELLHASLDRDALKLQRQAYPR